MNYAHRAWKNTQKRRQQQDKEVSQVLLSMDAAQGNGLAGLLTVGGLASFALLVIFLIVSVGVNKH